MCKVAGLQIERFYNVGWQRIEGSCPLVWGHCLQDKLFGFRRARFRNNIGNMHRLAANSKRGHPNNLSRDWLEFGHARQYSPWPTPKLGPLEAALVKGIHYRHNPLLDAKILHRFQDSV